MNDLWIQSSDGTYVAEVSELGCWPGARHLGGVRCPVCEKWVLPTNWVKTDYNADDVAGRHYACECGVKMLIIND